MLLFNDVLSLLPCEWYERHVVLAADVRSAGAALAEDTDSTFFFARRPAVDLAASLVPLNDIAVDISSSVSVKSSHRPCYAHTNTHTLDTFIRHLFTGLITQPTVSVRAMNTALSHQSHIGLAVNLRYRNYRLYYVLLPQRKMHILPTLLRHFLLIFASIN